MKFWKDIFEVVVDSAAVTKTELTDEGIVTGRLMKLRSSRVFRIDCVGLKTILLITFIDSPIVLGDVIPFALKVCVNTLLAIVTGPLKEAVLNVDK